MGSTGNGWKNSSRYAVMLLAVVVCALELPAVTISIDKSVRYQTIDGMGAFMSIAPWKYKSGPFYFDTNIDSVHFYDSLISQFGPTMIRVFPDWGFESDSGVFQVTSGGEFAMRGQFNHIRKLKAAAERQREPLHFIASVLSPPAYMKVSGLAQGLIEAAPNYHETDCRLKDGYDDVFARYCVRYLQMQKDCTGVDMLAFNIQNEPAFQEPYASCVYNAPRFTSVSTVVGEAIAQAGIPTMLFGAEHMAWAFPHSFESHIRNTPAARGHFKAWAVHGYRDGVQADTGSYQGETPTDKPLWMTETSGSGYGAVIGGMNDWGGAMTLARHIQGFLRNARASAWVYYTLMKNSSTGDFTSTYGLYTDGVPNAKGHVSAHFNRYIRPGARQVGSSSDDSQVPVVAFFQEQHACVSIVLINNAATSKTLSAINGTELPSEFEMITSTEAQKWVSTTVTRGSAITLPPLSVVTLVAGQYRGTEEVSVQPAAPQRATAAGRPLHHGVTRQAYALDGRLLSQTVAGGAARGVVLMRFVDGSVRSMIEAR